MLTQYSFINAQTLLIKPAERVRFVLLFLLATVGGLLVAKYIIHQLDRQFFGDQCTIPCAIVEGGIAGTLVGTLQWLVLRSYLPSRMWIVVFTLCSVLFNCSNAASTMITHSIFSEQVQTSQLTVPPTLFLIINMAIALAFGYLQWLVLRPYVLKARWWIILPLAVGVSGGLIFCIFILAPSLNHYGLFAFNAETIRLTGLASVQAIAFCLLQRKSRENPWLNSPLALAPDVSGYWENRRLAKKLYAQITKAWKRNLESNEKLVYFVGVDRTGSITQYEPMSSVATEDVKQTPLPDLTAGSEVESLTPLAKYKVTFIPPGSVKINSYRGTPLVLLALVMYAGILGMSKLLGLIEVAIGRVISF
jgi:hypothetical protein